MCSFLLHPGTNAEKNERVTTRVYILHAYCRRVRPVVLAHVAQVHIGSHAFAVVGQSDRTLL